MIRFPNPTYGISGGQLYVQGHVEILYKETWGTICDDGFGDGGARVLCRTNGYDDGFYARGKYKQPLAKKVGRIWLDQLKCRGNETNIDDCSHNPWGKHNCGHGEDIGIRCYGKILNFLVTYHTNHNFGFFLLFKGPYTHAQTHLHTHAHIINPLLCDV